MLTASGKMHGCPSLPLPLPHTSAPQVVADELAVYGGRTRTSPELVEETYYNKMLENVASRYSGFSGAALDTVQETEAVNVGYTAFSGGGGGGGGGQHADPRGTCTSTISILTSKTEISTPDCTVVGDQE